MRFVQYGLAHEVLKNIRNKNFDLDLVNHLPARVVDKIYFLEAEGITNLSNQEIETLADNYAYFLWRYHCSQESFRELGVQETRFDINEVKDRMDDLVKLMTSDRIIKS